MLANLSIGVDDWQRPELITSYYPEGLPEDWRYDYYFNDFRTVLVAQSEWMRWSNADVEELLHCRREDSALFLKIDDAQQALAYQLASLKHRLGDLIAGYLVFDDRLEDAQVLNLPGPLTRVSQQQALPGWQWRHQGWIVSGAPCGWLASLPVDMKQQRVALQDFVTSLPDNNTARAFFVGGESIKMVKIQELKTLAELLGY
ncbi:hypothetical protein [Thiomicrospira microaerophila]|uniref:hypothetical protein n=1 Tax=Thiomicrospira microaerophila TaxID=406020 RepID=UPI0005C8DEE4|nr:hypothetical protein [Thiomicrospira microaerophila]